MFDFSGQTSAKGAIEVSKGIAKCEDSDRIEVGIVLGGRGRSLFEITSSPISYDSLKGPLPKVTDKTPFHCSHGYCWHKPEV